MSIIDVFFLLLSRLTADTRVWFGFCIRNIVFTVERKT